MSKYSVSLEKVVKDLSFQVIYTPKDISDIYITAQDVNRPGLILTGFEDYFDPDSGRLVLGDMIISAQKVFEQAENYGHSVKREFAFLIAHSMLHLFGYDHMEDDERIIMEQKQREILEVLEIVR